MKQTVGARLFGMAADEILLYVPAQTYLEIKRKDPVPTFKAFVVGGEGTWQPTLVGIGSVVQRWFKSAVQKIVALLERWTPVYHLHSTQTEADGRQVIGRVVGRAEKLVDGILSALAIIYVLPEYQGLELDIASIEADVDVSAGAGGPSDIKDVNVLAITGIALGNSASNKPAYPGATLLASLQAFAGQGHTTGGNGMTREEVNAAIKELRLKPSDLFQPTEILGDPVVADHVREKTVGEYAHRKRTDEAFEKAKTDWEKEKSELVKKLDAAQGVAIKVASGEVFKAALKTRKLVDEAGKPRDEKLLKFINKNYERSFKPESQDSIQKDLDKFLDAQVDEWKDLGFGDATPPAGEGGGQTPPGGGPSAAAGEGAVDLTDPKHNPLIPQ